MGDAELVGELIFRYGCGACAEIQASLAPLEIQGTESLHEGFAEGTANSHGLTHAFHGGGEDRLRPGEFFKSEAGDLGHDVVEGGLEAGGGFPGNVVFQFIQGVSNGEFGRDFGDGESGGLGGKR